MRERFRPPIFVVPLTGLEPVWYLYRGILSPLRLPIPPQRRMKFGASARSRPAASATATAPRKAYRPPRSPPCYKKSIARDDAFRMEAPPGFEPGSQGFADLCLPKKQCGKYVWSGKRDSNPRHSPWQGDALPLSYSRIINIPHCMVEAIGIEPMTLCL